MKNNTSSLSQTTGEYGCVKLSVLWRYGIKYLSIRRQGDRLTWRRYLFYRQTMIKSVYQTTRKPVSEYETHTNVLQWDLFSLSKEFFSQKFNNLKTVIRKFIIFYSRVSQTFWLQLGRWFLSFIPRKQLDFVLTQETN